jgi:two-component system response regulator QseB
MRVLLVEDDKELGSCTAKGLEQNGYTVDWLREGQLVLNITNTNTETFEVILLDINLLDNISGWTVLSKLRARGIKTPVMILSALASVNDKIKALDSGADDYLPKPFDIEEVSARIRALYRRFNHHRATPQLLYRNINLDPSDHNKVMVSDKVVALSRREFALLEKLLEHPGRVVTREALMQCLYGWADEIDSNTLEVHIHNLRKKLAVSFITTIRGIGYMVEKEN